MVQRLKIELGRIELDQHIPFVHPPAVGYGAGETQSVDRHVRHGHRDGFGSLEFP